METGRSVEDMGLNQEAFHQIGNGFEAEEEVNKRRDDEHFLVPNSMQGSDIIYTPMQQRDLALRPTFDDGSHSNQFLYPPASEYLTISPTTTTFSPSTSSDASTRDYSPFYSDSGSLQPRALSHLQPGFASYPIEAPSPQYSYDSTASGMGTAPLKAKSWFAEIRHTYNQHQIEPPSPSSHFYPTPVASTSFYQQQQQQNLPMFHCDPSVVETTDQNQQSFEKLSFVTRTEGSAFLCQIPPPPSPAAVRLRRNSLTNYDSPKVYLGGKSRRPTTGGVTHEQETGNEARKRSRLNVIVPGNNDLDIIFPQSVSPLLTTTASRVKEMETLINGSRSGIASAPSSPHRQPTSRPIRAVRLRPSSAQHDRPVRTSPEPVTIVVDAPTVATTVTDVSPYPPNHVEFSQVQSPLPYEPAYSNDNIPSSLDNRNGSTSAPSAGLHFSTYPSSPYQNQPQSAPAIITHFQGHPHPLQHDNSTSHYFRFEGIDRNRHQDSLATDRFNPSSHPESPQYQSSSASLDPPLYHPRPRPPPILLDVPYPLAPLPLPHQNQYQPYSPLPNSADSQSFYYNQQHAAQRQDHRPQFTLGDALEPFASPAAPTSALAHLMNNQGPPPKVLPKPTKKAMKLAFMENLRWRQERGEYISEEEWAYLNPVQKPAKVVKRVQEDLQVVVSSSSGSVRAPLLNKDGKPRIMRGKGKKDPISTGAGPTFVNFTSHDSMEILNGVAPSGNQKKRPSY